VSSRCPKFYHYSFNRLFPDREEALRDDFTFDAGTYDYEDDGEWNDEEAAKWTEEEAPEEEVKDARDESTAYIEFLNEEASLLSRSTLTHFI